MQNKFQGGERAFAEKYAINNADYAIHGGAVPVRVRGVEGIAAVVVVSGLKQDEDHMVVIEGLEELKRNLEREEDGDQRTLHGDRGVEDMKVEHEA
jgi:uncharacterized protein (UPF0303 family)